MFRLSKTLALAIKATGSAQHPTGGLATSYVREQSYITHQNAHNTIHVLVEYCASCRGYKDAADFVEKKLKNVYETHVEVKGVPVKEPLGSFEVYVRRGHEPEPGMKIWSRLNGDGLVEVATTPKFLERLKEF